MPSPFAGTAAARMARRVALPLAKQAYRRWQALTPEEKERYRALARDYARKGRSTAEGLARRRRREPPPGP
jgi:hypothetical protein